MAQLASLALSHRLDRAADNLAVRAEDLALVNMSCVIHSCARLRYVISIHNCAICESHISKPDM